jgi:hypothetical protein
VLVGLPVHSIQKNVAADSAEIWHGFPELYLNFVQAFSALSSACRGCRYFKWLFGVCKAPIIPPMQIGNILISAAAVWYFTLAFIEREGHPSPPPASP